MAPFVSKLVIGVASHLVAKVVKPEQAAAAALKIAESAVKRTDTKVDDRIVRAFQECMED